MKRYGYDQGKTFAENKRLSIALQSESGPPVEVIRESYGREEFIGYLWPNGGFLSSDPLAFPEDPEPYPGHANWALYGERYQQTQKRRVVYWELRVSAEGKKFDHLFAIGQRQMTEDNVRAAEAQLEVVKHCHTMLAAVKEEVNPPVRTVPLTPEEQAQREAYYREQDNNKQRLQQRLQSLQQPKGS